MIRFKIFIPVVALIALISFVIFFRIEIWVKGWIESSISAITETKTDIRRLKISFKNSSLAIDRLEITSKGDPLVNALEFEDIVVNFQALPLLKKRFVVDEFSIRGIAWGTKRRKPGILPPQKKSKPSWLSQEMDKAVASVKLEISKTPVGKITDFALPDNPKDLLKELNFESEKAFTSMVTLSERLRAEWVDRYKTFRDLSEYERRAREVRGLISNPPQNPEGILKAIQTAQETQRFFESEKKKLDELTSAVKGDYQTISSEYEKAEKALKSDIDRAQKLVNLEGVNVANLSRLLFGNLWIDRAEEVLRFHALLRRFMAAKPAGEDIEVKERERGRDIVFINEKREPSFVWAKSDFSVKGIENGDRKKVNQLYEMKVRDINSSPRLYGKPTTIDLKAELKEALISKATFGANLDYTKAIDRETFSSAVEGLKIEKWNLGIPSLFPVILTDGSLKTQSDLRFEGDDFEWKSTLSFAKAHWDFSQVPNRGILVPILDGIFKEVNDFYLSIKMSHGKKGFEFDLESDMDSQIKAGIDAQLRKKLDELQERIKREVELQIAAYRKKATDELARFTTDITEKTKDFEGQLQSWIGDAKRAENELKAKSQKAVESKVGEGLKEVQKNLPKIPLPFKLGR